MADKPIPTPTLDKMKEVKSESQAIGEFLEWAQGQGLHLCEQVEVNSWGSQQYMPVSKSIETLLAEHFGIDLKKAEQEKRAILATLR